MKFFLFCSLLSASLACKPTADTAPTGALTGAYQFGGSLTIENYQKGYRYASTSSYSMVVTGTLLITTANNQASTIYENSTNPDVNGTYQVALANPSSLSLLGTDQFRDHTEKIQGYLSRISDKEIAVLRSVIDSTGSSYVYTKTLSIHAVKN